MTSGAVPDHPPAVAKGSAGAQIASLWPQRREPSCATCRMHRPRRPPGCGNSHTRTGSRLTSSMATGVLDRMWGPRKPFRGVLIRRGFESLPSVWDVLTHHRVLTSHTSPPSPGITCETAHLRRFLGRCATCLCDGEGVYAGARKSAPSARRGSTKRNGRRGATARYATWIVDGTTRKATKHVDTADHETSADHPDGAGLVGL
jgi:hypothetical protein